MASYGIKYQTSYKRRSGNLTTIDFLQSGYSGSVTTLIPDAKPLEITLNGNIDNIWEATQGSGASINLYVNPLTMLNDFFVTDPQNFVVKIYNGNSGDTLLWQGFINSGIYNEDYSTTDKVLITAQCGDGMALLDDLSYKPTESGSLLYDGSSTVGQVLSNILSKLNLTFTGIQTSCDLNLNGGGTNLFTNLLVNNNNYNDEKGYPMSCREVLNTIFQGLGLVMTFRADKIYLIDPINLHDVTKGNSYTISGSSETQTNIGGYKDISSGDVNWYLTGQSIDVVKPFNQIDLNYDPYTYLGDKYDFSTEGNFVSGSGSFNNMSSSLDSFLGMSFRGDYWWNSGSGFNNWILNSGVKGEGIKEITVLDDATPTYFIRRNLEEPNYGYYSYTFPFSSIKQDDNIMIELALDTYVNNAHIRNIVNPSGFGTSLHSCWMDGVYLSMGEGANKLWWNTVSQKWQVTEPLYYQAKMFIRQLNAKKTATTDESEIANNWTTSLMYAPLSFYAARDIAFLNGIIGVKILKHVNITYPDPLMTPIMNVCIKAVTVTIVKTDKTPIENTGVQTLMNTDNQTIRKRSPLTVTLKNGCGVYGSSRGAFASLRETPSGSNIQGMRRSGDANYYNTAKLVGQDLLSEYNTVRNKLSVNLDVQSDLLNIDKFLIKDSTYLGSKAFYIVSGRYDDQQESFSCEMIELASTRDTINN